MCQPLWEFPYFMLSTDFEDFSIKTMKICDLALETYEAFIQINVHLQAFEGLLWLFSAQCFMYFSYIFNGKLFYYLPYIFCFNFQWVHVLNILLKECYCWCLAFRKYIHHTYSKYCLWRTSTESGYGSCKGVTGAALNTITWRMLSLNWVNEKLMQLSVAAAVLCPLQLAVWHGSVLCLRCIILNPKEYGLQRRSDWRCQGLGMLHMAGEVWHGQIRRAWP